MHLRTIDQNHFQLTDLSGHDIVWQMVSRKPTYKHLWKLICTPNRGTIIKGTDVDIFKVKLTEFAKRQLSKMPTHIIRKLMSWIDGIENDGLHYMRKIAGYHDEALKGKRAGERSIRLSKSYRAIYVLDKEGKIEIIKLTEVSKHDY